MSERLKNIQHHLYEIKRHGEPAKIKIGSGLKDMLVDQTTLLMEELKQQEEEKPLQEQKTTP